MPPVSRRTKGLAPVPGAGRLVLQSWGIVSAAIWSWRASSVLRLAATREVIRGGGMSVAPVPMHLFLQAGTYAVHKRKRPGIGGTNNLLLQDEIKTAKEGLARGTLRERASWSSSSRRGEQAGVPADVGTLGERARGLIWKARQIRRAGGK